MKFPGEDSLRRERVRFMQTIESLTDDEFESGPTLCDGWAPRDVLAHIIGTDRLAQWYLRRTTLTGVDASGTSVSYVQNPPSATVVRAAPRTHPLTRVLGVAQVIADRGNGVTVRGSVGVSRAELTVRGWRCAESPTLSARAIGVLLLGDVAMHHQDVLRGLGRQREIPEEVAPALFREGRVWSWAFGAKLLRYRVVPTTPGGFTCGRGTPVRGTTEALALWLGGRRGIEPELKFA